MEEPLKRQIMLFGAICRVNNQYQSIGDKYYNGISLKQEYLLSLMEYSFSNKSPTLNELAESMGSSHQNVKQIVLKLVEKGYLTIEQDQQDKRKRRVCFTRKYLDNREKFVKRRDVFIRRIFNNVSDEEIESSLEVMGKIIKNQKKMLDNEDFTKEIFKEQTDESI